MYRAIFNSSIISILLIDTLVFRLLQFRRTKVIINLRSFQNSKPLLSKCTVHSLFQDARHFSFRNCYKLSQFVENIEQFLSRKILPFTTITRCTILLNFEFSRSRSILSYSFSPDIQSSIK